MTVRLRLTGTITPAQRTRGKRRSRRVGNTFKLLHGLRNVLRRRITIVCDVQFVRSVSTVVNVG